jgi:hypothetical protein
LPSQVDPKQVCRSNLKSEAFGMKIRCPVHGDFPVVAGGLPECPNCIRDRMKFPNGDDDKHTRTGAAASTSFATYQSDQLNSPTLFNFMASGGAQLWYDQKYKNYTASSTRPLGMA